MAIAKRRRSFAPVTSGADPMSTAARLAGIVVVARSPLSNVGSGKSKSVSVEAIVSAVRKHPKGVGGDVLRRELGAAKPAFYYHMNKALADRVVRRTGVKRATRYYLAK